MKIDLNIAVIKDEDGEIRMEVVDSDSPDEVRSKWLDNSVENLVKVCKVSLEDRSVVGLEYLPTKAYKAMEVIDSMSEMPHMQDLLMFIASEMFKEGMKHQADRHQKTLQFLTKEKEQWTDDQIPGLSQAVADLQSGTVTERVPEVLKRLADWHLSMYYDNNSAEHLMAKGMPEFDAKYQVEVFAEQQLELNTECLDLINELKS